MGLIGGRGCDTSGNSLTKPPNRRLFLKSTRFSWTGSWSYLGPWPFDPRCRHDDFCKSYALVPSRLSLETNRRIGTAAPKAARTLTQAAVWAIQKVIDIATKPFVFIDAQRTIIAAEKILTAALPLWNFRRGSWPTCLLTKIDFRVPAGVVPICDRLAGAEVGKWTDVRNFQTSCCCTANH